MQSQNFAEIGSAINELQLFKTRYEASSVYRSMMSYSDFQFFVKLLRNTNNNDFAILNSRDQM